MRCERPDVLYNTHSDEGLIPLYSFGPIAAVISLLSAVLTAFTSVLAPFAGESAAGIAVVLLTVCVRVLLVPVGVLQVRAEKARARIAPRLAEIGARYGKNPEKLVAEQRKVYAEAGTSPLAGCLPALAQMPVVMALYGMFIGAGGDAGSLLAYSFGGVELGATMAGTTEGVLVALIFVVLLVLLAVVAWATRRHIVLPTMRANAETNPRSPVQMPGVLTYTPFTTVVIAAFVPLAAGLYLLVSTSWALGERLVLRRFLPGGAPVGQDPVS